MNILLKTNLEEDSNAYVAKSKVAVEIDCDNLAEAYNKNPDYYDKILNNQVAEWSGTITSMTNSDDGEVLVYMQCRLGIIYNTGFFDKIIYRKCGEKFGGSIGRKYVVWSCKIISQRFRAVFSDKNSSCILNLLQ